MIRREGDDFILVDLESANGTYLNGVLVRQATLKHRDELCLGRDGPTLRFERHERGDGA